MTVYFITEEENSDCDPIRLKIGRAVKLKKRMSDLQTGNPDKLTVMGVIETDGEAADKVLEKKIQHHYAQQRSHKEWFYLNASDVIETLKAHSSTAYIAVGADAFEIISYDNDAIPEYANPWQWGDVTTHEFCPVCGWASAWSYNENFGGERCLKCGASEHQFESREEKF